MPEAISLLQMQGTQARNLIKSFRKTCLLSNHIIPIRDKVLVVPSFRDGAPGCCPGALGGCRNLWSHVTAEQEGFLSVKGASSSTLTLQLALASNARAEGFGKVSHAPSMSAVMSSRLGI